MHISLIDSTINQGYRMKLAVNIFGSDPLFLMIRTKICSHFFYIYRTEGSINKG